MHWEEFGGFMSFPFLFLFGRTNRATLGGAVVKPCCLTAGKVVGLIPDLWPFSVEFCMYY